MKAGTTPLRLLGRILLGLGLSWLVIAEALTYRKTGCVFDEVRLVCSGAEFVCNLVIIAMLGLTAAYAIGSALIGLRAQWVGGAKVTESEKR